MNSIATIDLNQVFYNHTENPLELTLKLPLDQDYAMGKLIMEIGDAVIEGKVFEK